MTHSGKKILSLSYKQVAERRFMLSSYDQTTTSLCDMTSPLCPIVQGRAASLSLKDMLVAQDGQSRVALSLKTAPEPPVSKGSMLEALQWMGMGKKARNTCSWDPETLKGPFFPPDGENMSDNEADIMRSRIPRFTQRNNIIEFRDLTVSKDNPLLELLLYMSPNKRFLSV